MKKFTLEIGVNFETQTMKKTALIYTPKYLNHVTVPSHPESPTRLKAIMRELHKSGILETGRFSLVEPKPIGVEHLEVVHETDYINLVKRFCSSGGGFLDLNDTSVCSESFEVALLAAAGAMKAVDLVKTGKFTTSFALVRPPGHHAGPDYALGFCIFNNAAIAAARLIHRYNLTRVLILDIDAHHGNGTQDIFYDTDKVLYVSLHQDPTLFPGTGFLDEVGVGKGVGFTVNIPFPFQIGDHTYLKAFNQIVTPIVQQYKPQFILLSVGFDGHYSDPVADLSLSAFSYLEVFKQASRFASRFCGGKLVAILEGGYNLTFLGKMTIAAVAHMAGVPYSLQDRQPFASHAVRGEGEKAIGEVKKIQSLFWGL